MPKVSYILICLLCTVYGALSSVGPQKSVQTGTFVQNSGHVRYTSGTRADHVVATHESGPLTTFIHPGGMHLVLYRQTADPHGQPCYDAIRVDAGLLNANPSARFTLTDVASQYHTYIQPSVFSNGARARLFSGIVFHEVLPGVDVRYTATAKGVKADYIVHPGTNPSAIKIFYNGATSVIRNADGGVEFTTPLGSVTESAPVAWTEGASRRAVAVQSVLQGSVLSFTVGEYNTNETLIIDPQIEWATYYSGNASFSQGIKTTIDTDGNVYIAGSTTARDLPIVSGVFQPRLKARSDAFVAKFTPEGDFVWNTYVGGTGRDELLGLCADTSGGVWICGSLDSSNHSLMDTAANINYNKRGSGPFGDLEGDTIVGLAGWVMRLQSDGFWGDSWIMDGSRADRVTGIAFNNGILAVCGETNSPRVSEQMGGAWGKNRANDTHNYDYFIARFSLKPGTTDRWRGDWLVYYGGDEDDKATGIAVDSFGIVTVAGSTKSANYPATDNSQLKNAMDIGVVHFATTGGIADRRWSFYLGGTDIWDAATDVTVDGKGNPIIVGVATSADFPVANAYQDVLQGSSDGFITKLNERNGTIAWSSFLGGNQGDRINTVSLTRDGRIWVGGETNGSTNLPVTADAFQKGPHVTGDYPSLSDGFVAMLSSDASQMMFCSYYGASPQNNLPPPPQPSNPLPPPSTDFGIDYVTGVCARGNAYVSIASYAKTRNMPTLKAYQDSSKVRADTIMGSGFVSYINNCKDTTITITVQGDTLICETETRQLRAPSGFNRYRWSTGETAQFINVSDSGYYHVVCTTIDGCMYRDTVHLSRAPKPTVSIGNDTTVCINTPVALRAIADGGTPPYTYKWRRLEPGPPYINNTESEAPEVNPPSTSNYVVVVKDFLGCTATDTIKVSIDNPGLQISKDSITWPFLDACESSVEDTLWLKNTSKQPMVVDSINTSIPVFSIVTDLTNGLHLKPGDSVQIIVKATPQASGTTTGLLMIIGSPCTWRQVVNLSVTKAQLVASIQPSVVNFCTILSCRPEVRDTQVNIRNNGTNDLELLPGSVPAPYAIVSPTTPLTLKSGESTKVTISFNPQANGTFGAVARVPFISGRCTDTLRINLNGKRDDVQLELVPQVLDAGLLQDCDASVDTAITLRNTGSAAATVQFPTDPEVVFTPQGPLTLQPGDSVVVRVTIQPAASGTMQKNITISAEPCAITLPLSVTAVKSGSSLAMPTVIDFGEISSCGGQQSATATFDVTYSGSDGTVQSVKTGSSITTSITSGNKLPDGVEQTFTVTWTPGTDGTLVDSIVCVVDPCSITRHIRVQGVRTTGAICAASPLIAHGTITSGATGTALFRNCGTDTLAPIVSSSGVLTILSQTPPAGAPLHVGDTLTIEYSVPCLATVNDTIRVQASAECASVATTAITAECNAAGPPSAIVTIDTISVKVGETFTLPLNLVASENLDFHKLTEWEAEITYNPMVIVGTGATPDCFTEGMYAPCSITIQGTRSSSAQILANLTFTAVLGSAPSTSVDITSFRWLADTTAAIQTRNGLVTISDICEAGGTRLLTPKNAPLDIRVYPVPATSTINVATSGLGEQKASFTLYDATGRMVAGGPLQSALTGEAVTTINTETIAAGTYILTVDIGGRLYRIPVLIMQ